MKQEFHKDVTVTTKGQLTLPIAVRRGLKLGSKRRVRVSLSEKGIVTLQTLPDAMSFFGIFKARGDFDPAEKIKGRRAMGRRAARRGAA